MQLPLLPLAADDFLKLLSQLALLFFFVVLPILQRGREKKKAGSGQRAPRRRSPGERAAERRHADDMWKRLLEGEEPEPAASRRAEPAPELPAAPEGAFADPVILEEVPEPRTPAPRAAVTREASGDPLVSVFDLAETDLYGEAPPLGPAEVGEPIHASIGAGTSGALSSALALPSLSAGLSAIAGPRAGGSGRRAGRSPLLADLRRPADWRRAVVLAEVLGAPRAFAAHAAGAGGGFGAPPGLGGR